MSFFNHELITRLGLIYPEMTESGTVDYGWRHEVDFLSEHRPDRKTRNVDTSGTIRDLAEAASDGQQLSTQQLFHQSGGTVFNRDLERRVGDTDVWRSGARIVEEDDFRTVDGDEASVSLLEST